MLAVQLVGHPIVMATSEERSAARKGAQREWAISYYGRMRHRVGMRIDQAIAAGKSPEREDLNAYDEYRQQLSLLAAMPSETPALLPSKVRYYRDKLTKVRARLVSRNHRVRPERDIQLVRKYSALLGVPEPEWLAPYLGISGETGPDHWRAHKAVKRVTRGVATEKDLAFLTDYTQQRAKGPANEDA